MQLMKVKGFSLMEIAIGMLILSLVIVSFNHIFKLVFDTDHTLEEKNNILRIEKSLKTYLRVNMHLPCPDTDGDGRENRTVNDTCTSREGTLPYNDIGASEKDAWGNAYYYRVHERAINTDYVHDVCEPASVMGKTGSLEYLIDTLSVSGLNYCNTTATYYCNNAPDSGACDATEMVDNVPPEDITVPPFYRLYTRPYGDVSGTNNITIYDESGRNDINLLDAGIVVMVISWGADGDSVYRSASGSSAGCTQTAVDNGLITDNEYENCNSGAAAVRVYVDTKTGKNRDFLAWITVNDAKMAYVIQPR